MMPNQEMDTQSVEQRLLEFEQTVRIGDTGRIRDMVGGLHPSEIADLIEALPAELRAVVWDSTPADQRGEVLTETHDEVRDQLIAETTPEDLVAALEHLDMDELADLDEYVPTRVLDALVQAMDMQRRKRYQAVRNYADDTAGGLMDADAAAVRTDVTLDVVLRYVRALWKRDHNLPEHFDSMVVVDRSNRYQGMLRLGDLISRSPDLRVADVMDVDAAPFPADTPATKVARLFEDRDLISAAVVDSDGRLLGRITIDDVVDVIREEADHTLMSQAGLHEETDIFAPVMNSVRQRAVWLGVNLINAFLAAWVIGLFDQSIEKLVALAVLMPVVASMGGVAGNQTLILVIRGIALEQIGRANAWRLLINELGVGLANGLLWALVVATAAMLWFGSVQLGIVFAMALVINLINGAVAGTLVPLGLQRIGIDPALAGGVLLTAATDVVGFFSFLGLATLILI